MGTFSLSHWLVVLVVVLILFDLARGIRAFRAGMREDKTGEAAEDKLVEAQPADGKPG